MQYKIIPNFTKSIFIKIAQSYPQMSYQSKQTPHTSQLESFISQGFKLAKTKPNPALSEFQESSDRENEELVLIKIPKLVNPIFNPTVRYRKTRRQDPQIQREKGPYPRQRGRQKQRKSPKNRFRERIQPVQVRSRAGRRGYAGNEYPTAPNALPNSVLLIPTR